MTRDEYLNYLSARERCCKALRMAMIVFIDRMPEDGQMFSSRQFQSIANEVREFGVMVSSRQSKAVGAWELTFIYGTTLLRPEEKSITIPTINGLTNYGRQNIMDNRKGLENDIRIKGIERLEKAIDRIEWSKDNFDKAVRKWQRIQVLATEINKMGISGFGRIDVTECPIR